MSIESLPISVDPSFEVVPPAVAQEQADQATDYKKVGILLGAAFITWRVLIKDNMPALENPTAVTISEALKDLVSKYGPTWAKLTVPALEKAYQLGSHGALDEEEISYLARVYSAEMGDYINQTSAQALLEGFNALVNQRWSPQIAYQRALEGVGLAPRQMQQYITAMDNLDAKYLPNSITDDPRVNSTLTKLLADRSLSIGENEAYTVQEMGRQLMWMRAAEQGLISPDVRRMWRVTKDERTCPLCLPMNEKTTGLTERFEVDGAKYWTPAVHPNCRCWVELIEPEIDDSVAKAYDPQEHPRGGNPKNKGQFSRHWGQNSQVTFKERGDVNDIVDQIIADALKPKEIQDLKHSDLKFQAIGANDLKGVADLKSSTVAPVSRADLKNVAAIKPFIPVVGLTVPQAVVLHYKSKPLPNFTDLAEADEMGITLPVEGLWAFEYQGNDYREGEVIDGRSISHPFVDKEDMAYEMANDYADHIKGSIYEAMQQSPALKRRFEDYLSDEIGIQLRDMDDHALNAISIQVGELSTDIYDDRDVVINEIREYLMEPHLSEVPQSHHSNAQEIMSDYHEFMDAEDAALSQIMTDLMDNNDPATSEAARHLIPEIYPSGVPYDEGSTSLRALIPTIYVVEDITEAGILDAPNVDLGSGYTSRPYILDGTYQVTHASYYTAPTSFPEVQVVYLRKNDDIEKRYDSFGVVHLAVKRAK